MSLAPTTAPVERRRVEVTGTVQGVGFRPFVYRHALRLGLRGWVRNGSGGVVIEAEGPTAALDELCRLLEHQPPSLARVAAVTSRPVPSTRDTGTFRIVASTDEPGATTPVSADTATCDDCLAEIADPRARRYRYPFTNCTACGPRYTIVTAIPYDRPATTMASFAMCAACRTEYHDPTDRRFHAQPIACPDCGPTLTLFRPGTEDRAQGDDALRGAAAAVLSGAAVAVKGLGGYHLAVDATSAPAVAQLRQRKARDAKPFAVMVADVDTARRLCLLDEPAEAALRSPARPIVIAPRRPPVDGALDLAPGVAPGLGDLGLMLPYTPLHHLLLAEVGRPIVLTSGNLSDEPIAHDDGDAVARLDTLADLFLGHDRPIHIRCDDSVVSCRGGAPQLLRRSRGWAPEPTPLPVASPRTVLAVGGQLKNTLAVAAGPAAVASHHIGDIEDVETWRSFEQAADHLQRLTRCTAEVIAHDLHPDYLSTKWALEQELPSIGVQHHHAHVAACLVEHGQTGPVLGVAFDGHGYGGDGTLWGGELLLADLTSSRRLGHLRPVPLAGGVRAIRQPWRMALVWAAAACGADTVARLGAELDERWAGVLAVAQSGAAAPTTSAGRLFDAAAGLLAVRSVADYEGQAAMELEALARTVPVDSGPALPFDRQEADSGAPAVLDPRPAIAALVEERDRGAAVPVLAAAFHDSLARATADLAADLAASAGVDTVVLTGGVFQNARLAAATGARLTRHGLRVLEHERIPPNDGGLSLGQAAVAAARLAANA